MKSHRLPLLITIAVVGMPGYAQSPTPASPMASGVPVVTLPAAPPPPAPPPRVMPALSDSLVQQLRAMLADASADGIGSSDGDRAAPATGDTKALVQAALDHAQALHHGRLAPSDYLWEWGLKPPAYDPWPDFIAAVHADRLANWIASLPPAYTGYGTLKKGLATYRAIEQAGGWPVVPDGPALAEGATGSRVATLRQRLSIEDPLLTKSPATFDADVTAAVRRAQRRYGLEPSGTVDKATLAALNVSAHDRVRQIAANMERWRWLPPSLAPHRFQVNIAAAVLTVFDGDKPVTSMRAVTGRPDDKTPMLSSNITSIVFNPPWNVPTSIATKELWPKERAHKGYLAAHGYRVIATPEGGSRLQQKSGPKSALGRVKFDFVNPYGVYLHDTPSQGTFGKYSRLASHGCVRLARPVDLAKLALQGDPTWTPDAIDAALAKGDTVRAKLPEAIAVYLFYWTAYASADGKVSFLADPYGWDTQLASKIEANANRARQTIVTQ